MKVLLEDKYEEYYTIRDLERANTIIAQEAEDESSVEEWAEYAAGEALKNINDGLEEILKASAHTAKNGRAWNLYSSDSGQMDIWIDAIAKTDFGFIMIGAYLSDIWQTGAKSYKEHMFIRYFKEDQSKRSPVI